MTRLATILLTAGFAAGLAATAAAADTPCLRTRGIDGFVEATTSSIVMTQGQRRWKADMAGACTDLDSALGIAAISRGACLKSGDKVQYKDKVGGNRTCKIATLTYLTPEAAAQ